MNYTDWNNLPVRCNHVPDLILDDGSEFDWPLWLDDRYLPVLRRAGLSVLADRRRLSDIDDITEVLITLQYQRQEHDDPVALGPIGLGEETADDLYRECLKIWNAWDQQR